LQAGRAGGDQGGVNARSPDYFFCASTTLLQASESLSLCLLKQAKTRPPPGMVPLERAVVALAGCALLGGEILTKCGVERNQDE
jgi:hypothetical protein